MQFIDILCYLLLMITVTASNLEAEDNSTNALKQSQPERRITKREATIIMGYPLEPNSIFQKPKVIYRRISQPQRYVPPALKFRSPKPRRKAQKSSKLNRKPNKKYRGHKNKHFPSKPAFKSYKPKWYRDSVPKYGPPSFKPKGHLEPNFKSKIPGYEYTSPENMSFGEPPLKTTSSYYPKVEGYGEPPIDSFGAPMKLTKNRIVLPQGFQESNYEKDKDQKHKQSSWEYNQDNNLSYSKKKPAFAIPEADEMFATATAQDNDFLETYKVNASDNKYYKQRKPHIIDNNKVVKSPWQVQKRPNPDGELRVFNKKRPAFDDEVIVGGQYAEPPARYVGKFQPSAPMFKEDENTFLPMRDVVDHAIPSKGISPYINYRNGNIAFSPQNLNDAFGIVDK